MKSISNADSWKLPTMAPSRHLQWMFPSTVQLRRRLSDMASIPSCMLLPKHSTTLHFAMHVSFLLQAEGCSLPEGERSAWTKCIPAAHVLGHVKRTMD